MTPDDLLDLLRTRRSTKLTNLRPDPVDPAQIQKCLEAANWAPSHGQTEPWRFSVYTGDGRLPLGQAFADAYRLDAEEKGNFTQSAYDGHLAKVHQASVWISLGMQPKLKPDGSRAMPEWEEMAAASIAAQHIHLMATTLRLAGQWTSNPTAIHTKTAEFVGLTPPGRLLGFLFLGHPISENALPRAGVRQPIDSKVHLNG